MTSQDYMIRENIELTNIAGSNLVIGSKKIILQEKVDIFVPPIVKSNTGIIIADASTDLNRIYAEVSGKSDKGGNENGFFTAYYYINRWK